MAQNFRTAFRGFNQEDVVNYLEFMNNQYLLRVNQIDLEVEYLRKRIEGTGPTYAEYTALTTELEAANRTASELLAANEQLRQEIEALKEQLNAKSSGESTEDIQRLKDENIKLKEALYHLMKRSSNSTSDETA